MSWMNDDEKNKEGRGDVLLQTPTGINNTTQKGKKKKKKESEITSILTLRFKPSPRRDDDAVPIALSPSPLTQPNSPS